MTPKRDVVVIGASSGGVEALRNLVGGLPGDLPAAVFVVVHLPEGASSSLPHILDRSRPLKAAAASDGDEILPGRIYVARPDYHLLLQDGRVRLTRGPRENRHRPAVDALFRTAAVALGPRVIGVILTGARDGGAAGDQTPRRRRGGAGPRRRPFPGMPESALRHAEVDHRVPLDGIAPLLARLTREEVPAGKGSYPVPDEMDLEARVAGIDPSAINSDERPGKPSPFTCPECSGPLFEIQDARLVRFRCRVSHAFTTESMLDEKSKAIENALYSAMNTLEESALVSDVLAARSREGTSGTPPRASNSGPTKHAAMPKAFEKCSSAKDRVPNSEAFALLAPLSENRESTRTDLGKGRCSKVGRWERRNTGLETVAGTLLPGMGPFAWAIRCKSRACFGLSVAYGRAGGCLRTTGTR